MTRVAFIVLDGMPSRHVTPEITPALWALAGEAGQRPGEATGVMPAATYPNHATFMTGTRPETHGVLANWFFVDGRPTPAEAVGVAGRTLFDACADAGRSSAFVAGDQHLVGVMGATCADEHWPDAGQIPEGCSRDAKGYVADTESVPRLAAAVEAGHDLVVAQVQGADTAGHLLGPDTDDARDAYRAVDQLLPRIREAVDPAWDDTVVIIVSDHTMETLTSPEPIDVLALADEHGAFGLPGGGSALVLGDDEPSWLDEVPGHGGRRMVRAGLWEAWTEPGWWFAVEGLDSEYRGMHGNPTTLAQVAVVTGGHHLAAELADVVADGGVSALDWAPTMAGLLGLDLPGASGLNLLPE